MPIYRVTSSVEVEYDETAGIVIRATGNLEAINIALKCSGTERWTTANCSTELIPEEGKDKIILRDFRAG